MEEDGRPSVTIITGTIIISVTDCRAIGGVGGNTARSAILDVITRQED